MNDTARISVDTFKMNLFIWEVIIAAIVFTAAWFILKKFKENEMKAKEENKKFNKGQSGPQ
ncbi:MAG: hypothetical protein IT244_12180 [Bacteroidia bacterium]|nr:hypothetical protein [Bacteroidia bacterium]